MTKEELITLVEREIMELSGKFDPENFSDAVDEAQRETGFSCPVETDFQILWLKHRTKRALFQFIVAGAAKKFKYEGINLNQAFDHYRTLISDFDKEFKDAKQEHATEFAGVESYQMFGTKINAGFQYDPITGEDTTYTEKNQITLSPDQADE